MTGSKNDRSASANATHQSTAASSSGGQRRPPWPAYSAQRRRSTTAHRQAIAIVASRNGPAATLVLAMCGASDVHSVGWLTTGESGWLVTAW